MNKSKQLDLPEEYDEITVAILGNANSGKSSLVGVLTNPILRKLPKGTSSIVGIENASAIPGATTPGIPDMPKIPEECLDNGNGLSRSRILQYKHEQNTGRTSSITYEHMVIENDDPKLNNGHSRIVSFVDLAGHELYLKTTITGVTSSYPDYAFVCVEKNITPITKEHIGILVNMGIPFTLVFNKIDIIPDHIINENIKKLSVQMNRCKRPMCEIGSFCRAETGSKTEAHNESASTKKNTYMENIKEIEKVLDESKINNITPYIRISNKTGKNIPVLMEILKRLPHRKKQLVDGFMIDHVYRNVAGFGLVVSGVNGIVVNKGDELIMGPLCNNKFVKVKVKTIHNDYRHFVDKLQPNVRGCLCIKVMSRDKVYIRKGMVITHPDNISYINGIPPKIKTVDKFSAEIVVFGGNSTEIKKGYSAFMNTGIVKEAVRFARIYNKGDNLDVEMITNKNRVSVDVEFLKNYNCVNIGDRFLFREGNTRGIGQITAL